MAQAQLVADLIFPELKPCGTEDSMLDFLPCFLERLTEDHTSLHPINHRVPTVDDDVYLAILTID